MTDPKPGRQPETGKKPTGTIRERAVEFINSARDFLNAAYIGENTYNLLLTKIINMVKVFIVSTRKFVRDSCTTKASSIAYTTIISLIPTLTVAITFYSIFSGVGNKKEELFRRVTLFMLEHNIRLNIDPVLNSISGLIDNAGKIGGIGAIIMVFTATAVLRTLENTLNEIWEVKKSRAMALRMIYYWAALTLGPILLISATTVATQISNTFSSPSYFSTFVEGNRIWLVGDRGTIRNTQADSLKLKNFDYTRVDFDNQKVYRFDSPAAGFIEDEFRIEPLDLKKSTFRDIQFIGKNGWIVGRGGILLTTQNGGESWTLERFGMLNFNDIHMVSPLRGFLVTDNGYLLSTETGGRKWKVREWADYSSSLNSIAFNREKGIITGDKGTVLTTSNSGLDWTMSVIDEARRKNRHVNLNRAFFLNAATVWMVGDEGVLMNSEDGGKTWSSKKFQENNYLTVHFTNREEGMVAGENGILIRTKDGGDHWTRASITDSRINSINQTGGKLWISGDNGLVMSSTNAGRSWSGVEGKSFVVMLLNFFAPFVFIWLLFLVTYMILPNIKVPFKPAAIGAAFTGTVWVIFILLFIVYVKYFAGGSVAIYGALASVPIFLLMVYASALIMLFGAEVSYTLMHPHTYLRLAIGRRGMQDIHVVYGLAILHFIFSRFEQGKGETSYAELLKLTMNNDREVDHYVELFRAEKLIIENGEDRYLPSTSSKNVQLAPVISMMHNVGMGLPPTAPASAQVRKYMQKVLHEMNASRGKIIGNASLNDLIEGRA